MSPRAIEWKVQIGQWRPVYRGVYATFTGPLPRKAELWAAVLYAGEGAMLSHESAGELSGLVDKPADGIHVTVPGGRRVTPVAGLVIHVSDLPDRPAEHEPGEVPVTLVADTIVDLAESYGRLDDVYGLVARAFGRSEVRVNVVDLLATVELRRKLRWRTELKEAIVDAAGGSHSALELLWDRNVEQAHGLPVSRKQVPFTKAGGTVGYRDREYQPWGVIIELDGRKSHPGEQRGQDNARDRQATVGRKETLRYGWRETRYEACESAVQVIRLLWRRGWRGRPKPCSRDCPVAGLLRQLANWLAESPGRQRKWLEQQAVQEAAQEEAAQRLAAQWEAVRQAAENMALARRQARSIQQAARRPAARARPPGPARPGRPQPPVSRRLGCDRTGTQRAG